MKKAITLKDEEGNQIYPSPYYPIGSIYMSVMQVDPAKIFGGTWEQIEDVFLLGCGSRYKNGTIGGEASHALSLEEIPSHIGMIIYMAIMVLEEEPVGELEQHIQVH